MKFTKEQAVEKLNQMLTNGGKKPLRMSTKTLNEHAENLMELVADEEMELDDFVAKVKPMLENVNSNMEKDRSDFIKEYEKAHPAPQEPATQEPAGKDGDPNKVTIESLQKQLDDIVAQQKKDLERAAIESKRAEIRKYLADNNVKDEDWIDSILTIANIGEDDDAEEKGKTYLNLYNKSKAGSEPITPFSPKPGGGADPKDAFSELIELRKAREGQQ